MGSKLPQNLQDWTDARKRHRLSHAQVQMARELGLNPRKLGKIDNHKQELWKAPLPEYIERLYFKRFAKERPDDVRSVEQIAERLAMKKAAKSAAKTVRKQTNQMAGTSDNDPEPERLDLNGSEPDTANFG
jgi:hypothetical protein